MKNTLFLFAILITLGLSLKLNVNHNLKVSDFLNFDDYIGKFNKEYNTTQYAKRKLLYDARILQLIKIQDYTPAVNQFSDRTVEQLNKLKGLLELQNQQSTVLESSSRLQTPSEVDWRKTAVTSVKNQGFCGSCWAFAAVAYSESKMIIDDRYDTDLDLSEQRLLQCTRQSSCDGGYMQYAMEQVLDQIPFELLYSYHPHGLYGSPICQVPGVSIGKIDQHFYDLSVSQLEQLVAKRPVAIGLSADNWQNYGSGIFKCSINARINHAVLLVGYTSDYWIVKNSWGTNWGEDGYIRITKSPLQNCGIGKSVHQTYQSHIQTLIITLIVLATVLMF